MFMPTVFHENLFDDLFDPFWNEGALERVMNREARDTFGKRGANMMKCAATAMTKRTTRVAMCGARPSPAAAPAASMWAK